MSDAGSPGDGEVDTLLDETFMMAAITVLLGLALLQIVYLRTHAPMELQTTHPHPRLAAGEKYVHASCITRCMVCTVRRY